VHPAGAAPSLSKRSVPTDRIQVEPNLVTQPRSPWRRWAPILTSVSIYAAIALFGWGSIWSHGGSRFAVQGGADPAVSMWFLTWAPYTLLHPHNPLFSNYGNYPFGVNMVLNTAVLPLGYLLTPVTLLAGPVASFNVLGMVSPILAACSALALLRRFTTWYPAAFVGGLLFGFSPYVVAQATGHLNLEFVALLPLILLVLHDLVVSQRGRPVRKGFWLGVLIIVQFFISSELLFDTLLLALAGVIIIAVLDGGKVRSHVRFAAPGLGTAALMVVVALAYPVWFVLAGPGHVVGPIQLSSQEYRADLLGSIVPDSFERFAPSAFTRAADKFVHGYRIENGSYLGLPLVAFLIAAAIVLRRNRVVLVAALLGGLAFVLSLGSTLELANHDYVSVVLPETVLAKLPLSSNVIPARFSLFVTLFAALVLGVALERLHAAGFWRWSKAEVVAPLALGLGLLVPLVPAWPMAAQATVIPYFTSAAARAIPLNSVALVYPFPDQFYARPQAWQASTFLRFKMPGGRFIVPEPGTKIAGTSRSSVTDSVLRKLALGRPPPRSPALRSEVDDQLRAWHVRTVLAAPEGADPARAISYLTWLLGRPPRTSNGITVWYAWRPSPPP
jgi:hypothetical protein